MSTFIKIGICADHGGFELKEKIKSFLAENQFEPIDYGATELNSSDDFPDFVIPLAKAVASKEVFRGIAICGSGVGACIAANKIPNIRAALITEHFSAHQGVEDDDMNLICLGGRITGYAVAEELVLAFLNAEFIGAERHLRRLAKIQNLENPS
ncbi:RpiB/LacA/LacB family sugar-phosphate isomerase [Chryseobacterium sp. RG1]|uniref:RpiB/LacA/LacB family sugar-phosphate isomerase n=1 Tax=Chryseobacterium tagetis TaxID=2801334 RepID=A0ABS8A1T2_9FLAO|nr:RpiB/LacA/LacB family sugar-phosphate isomerase [Chryseobacterium tagetis]MCA6067942.1 RpiB/LacA/LacB family sugar-phosphate isomerase [Chryseobacterium tagetis]